MESNNQNRYEKQLSERLEERLHNSKSSLRRRYNVRVLGGDTECPLQVCELSRSSESFHFLSLRSRSFIRFHQSPGWLLRSETRASDLFPDYPEYKTPTLSFETHPNDLNSNNYRPFEAVS